MRRTFQALLIVLAAASSGQGQGAARRFTTIDALRQFPGFYHLQNVLLRGEIVENGTRLVLRSDEQEMRVLLDLRRHGIAVFGHGAECTDARALRQACTAFAAALGWLRSRAPGFPVPRGQEVHVPWQGCCSSSF